MSTQSYFSDTEKDCYLKLNCKAAAAKADLFKFHLIVQLNVVVYKNLNFVFLKSEREFIC